MEEGWIGAHCPIIYRFYVGIFRLRVCLRLLLQVQLVCALTSSLALWMQNHVTNCPLYLSWNLLIPLALTSTCPRAASVRRLRRQLSLKQQHHTHLQCKCHAFLSLHLHHHLIYYLTPLNLPPKTYRILSAVSLMVRDLQLEAVLAGSCAESENLLVKGLFVYTQMVSACPFLPHTIPLISEDRLTLYLNASFGTSHSFRYHLSLCMTCTP